jgi:hypothetical protein
VSTRLTQQRWLRQRHYTDSNGLNGIARSNRFQACQVGPSPDPGLSLARIEKLEHGVHDLDTNVTGDAYGKEGPSCVLLT